MKVYLGILDALQLDNKDPNDLLTLGVADAEPAHAPPPFGAMRSGRPGSRRLEPEEAGPTLLQLLKGGQHVDPHGRWIRIV